MSDQRFSLVKQPDGTVLHPISPSCLPQLDLLALRKACASGVCDLTWSLPPLQSKKEKGRTCGNKLERSLKELLESQGERWLEELRRDLPRSFHRHGDLILLGDNCFTLPIWKKIGDLLWSAVANELGAKRLAKMSRISKDGFRSPLVTMLLGDDSWVKHVDNGISYEFDVTKCMFSAGNITEKLRVAGFDCRGETVVDLYAGDGSTWCILVINRNVELQKTSLSSFLCIIFFLSSQVQLCNIADRVNLGLIPSSEDAWPVACRLLKRTTGGVLHIHQNVTSPLQNTAASDGAPQTVSAKSADREVWQAWAEDAANRIASLLKDLTGAPWLMKIQRIEHVKSYAPHVHHVVLDLDCRPCALTGRFLHQS
uniref:tRNA(Phe) (4-demethylwyosine(37)-C(7)) aminocarboxypropyltransferase n=1 Tax=Fundulus heteroclitus TaxID=8078 RepID=A0A3Q2PQ23_FUNHE